MGDPPAVTEVEDQNHIRLLLSIRWVRCRRGKMGVKMG